MSEGVKVYVSAQVWNGKAAWVCAAPNKDVDGWVILKSDDKKSKSTLQLETKAIRAVRRYLGIDKDAHLVVYTRNPHLRKQGRRGCEIVLIGVKSEGVDAQRQAIVRNKAMAMVGVKESDLQPLREARIAEQRRHREQKKAQRKERRDDDNAETAQELLHEDCARR